MAHRLRSLLLASAVSAALLSPVPATAATLRGHVVSGTTPLPSLLVALYATDPSHPERCAGVLGAAPTRHDGSFEFLLHAAVGRRRRAVRDRRRQIRAG